MTIFSMTVDCDSTRGDIQQQRECITKLFEIFDQADLRGAVTWYINEYDFPWIENYPDLLEEVERRGDATGVHGHFTSMRGMSDYFRDGSLFAEKIDLLVEGIETVKSVLNAEPAKQDEVLAGRFGL